MFDFLVTLGSFPSLWKKAFLPSCLPQLHTVAGWVTQFGGRIGVLGPDGGHPFHWGPGGWGSSPGGGWRPGGRRPAGTRPAGLSWRWRRSVGISQSRQSFTYNASAEGQMAETVFLVPLVSFPSLRKLSAHHITKRKAPGEGCWSRMMSRPGRPLVRLW